MIIKRTERGWPGHFIGSNSCRFHRNTLLGYGKKRVVVSTVGNYHPFPNKNGMTEIGYDRYYETMAFWAKKDGPYWDADVGREVSFDFNWGIFGDERKEMGVDNRANDIHEAVVREVSEKLEKGWIRGNNEGNNG